MCTQQRWIKNKYDGSTHFVKCGHCKACQQEKSIARTSRIRDEFESGGRRSLFVTLSYRDSFVPYILKDDLRSYRVGRLDYVPVRRDAHVRRTKSGTKFVKFTPVQVIDEVYSSDMYRYGVYRPLEGIDSEWSELMAWNNMHRVDGFGCHHFKRDRIAVIRRKDVQDFFKRLRAWIGYNYNSSVKYEVSYEYFYATEYGGKYGRPHCHVLLSFPDEQGLDAVFKQAIIASWSYANLAGLPRSIETPRDPASYLSSYVNCDSYVPAPLRRAAAWSSSHRASHRLGVHHQDLDYKAVRAALLSGNRRRTISRTSKGVTTVLDVPYPSYIVDKYWPKFKGVARLADYEILRLISRPDERDPGSFKGSYTASDRHLIGRRFINLFKRLGIADSDRLQYAEDYLRIHRLRPLWLIRDSMERVGSFIGWREFYLNYDDYVHRLEPFGDYYFSDLYKVAPTVARSWESISGFVHHSVLISPNYFSDNLKKHKILEDSYDMYTKSRKIALDKQVV